MTMPGENVHSDEQTAVDGTGAECGARHPTIFGPVASKDRTRRTARAASGTVTMVLAHLLQRGTAVRANRSARLPMACALMAFAGCSVLGGDAVRDQWEERPTFASCGEVTLKQGERLPQKGHSEVACLRAALDAGSGAELKVVFPTVEGDPVAEYYRVTPSRTTEVYVDSTKDVFSDQTWSFADCGKPESVLDVNC
jgi:hypothetical protein